jgi:hypothetical protein
MQPVEITFQRAFKVWWSYTWRAWVLWMLVFMVMGLALQASGIMPRNSARPHVPPAPEQLRHSLSLLFVVLVALSIVQIFAVRWCLKTRWSDFKLVAMAPDQN